MRDKSEVTQKRQQTDDHKTGTTRTIKQIWKTPVLIEEDISQTRDQQPGMPDAPGQYSAS